MSDLNPYTPPHTTDPPVRTRSGRLDIHFQFATDDQQLAGIRSLMPTDAAEHLGSAVLLSGLVATGVLAVALLQPVLLLVGAGVTVFAAFAVREYWLRRMAFRCLDALRSELGAVPGATCQVQLTRTKLLLDVSGKHAVWPIRHVVVRFRSAGSRSSPWIEMALVRRASLVLPLPITAFFEDLTPREFHMTLEERQQACWHRRKRYRWSRFWSSAAAILRD